jgi:hypothetical protein
VAPRLTPERNRLDNRKHGQQWHLRGAKKYKKLLDKIKTNLDAPKICTLKTYQVVFIIECKLQIWVYQMSIGDTWHTAERGKEMLQVLSRVYEKILELAWTHSDDEVVEAIKDSLNSVHLYTTTNGKLDP